MPVILTREAKEVWLDTKMNTATDVERLMGLLVPCPPAQMRVYPVGREVNSPRNGRSTVIQEIAI